jgi:hypothetical protein
MGLRMSAVPDVEQVCEGRPEQQSTPVSDLMARENHVFTVVPKTAVDPDLDWRLPVFEAGRYLLAFDGAALLLLELWRRNQANSTVGPQAPSAVSSLQARGGVYGRSEG